MSKPTPTLTLKIGMLPPGLNSSGGNSKSKGRTKGLLNMHHSEYGEMKRSWATIIQSAVANAVGYGFEGFGVGPVWMMVIRFSTGIMDRDNAWSSMKPIMDGLVRAGVMADDNEVILPWPRMLQVKVSSKGHCGLVIIMRQMEDHEVNDIVSLRTWARSIGHPTTGEIASNFEQ